MKRCIRFLIIVGSLLPGVISAQAVKECSQQGVVIPTFEKKNFPQPTTINNQYFPLVVGTTFVYESTQGRRERVVVEVTPVIKEILGIDCRVVRDRVTVGGEVVEDTLDFFAQDKDGNVWYLGEESRDFKNAVQVGTGGSWEAGVDGATPGFIMLAQPVVGDAYRQENAPDVAEDTARLVNLNGSATVPFGTFPNNVLVTSECTPLEPKVVEEKSYALGVGLVRTVKVAGGSGEWVLVSITQP